MSKEVVLTVVLTVPNSWSAEDARDDLYWSLEDGRGLPDEVLRIEVQVANDGD